MEDLDYDAFRVPCKLPLVGDAIEGDYSLPISRRNSFRVIGGSWRGRRLTFPDVAAIRPSPDRVRETLFNWLRWELAGSRCLDLFAGSGALGIEALSHGAASVDFVDSDRRALAAIAEHLKALGSDAGRIHFIDARAFLDGAVQAYDIVFLDPPFAAGLAPALLHALSARAWVRPGGWVYLEQAAADQVPDLPPGWVLHRSRRAGEVGYHLLHRTTEVPA